MVRFVAGHLKLKKISKRVVKKFPFVVISYAPDQYETQEMCDKAILENSGTLKSVPECYKNKRKCSSKCL